MKIVWFEIDLNWNIIAWTEVIWWFVFLCIIMLGGWYLYWFTAIPFWSFEPILKKNDLMQGIFGSTYWKKIGYNKYYLDDIVTLYFNTSYLSEDKLSEEDRKEAVDKWMIYVSNTLLEDMTYDVGMSWNMNKHNVTNGLMIGDICLSCFIGERQKSDLYELSNREKSGNFNKKEKKEKNENDENNKENEKGWIVTQSFWLRRLCRYENDYLRQIVTNTLDWLWGKDENECKERLWNVLSLCVRSSLDKERQYLTRKLFSTHMARIVFSKPIDSRYRCIGEVSGGIFRQRITNNNNSNMKGVIPFIVLDVIEMELNRNVVRPFSKRELKRLGSSGRGRMVRVTNVLLKERVWMELLYNWYYEFEKGNCINGMEWIGMVDWDIFLKRIEYGFLHIFLWIFESTDANNKNGVNEMEIGSIYFFKDENKTEKLEGDIKGMRVIEKKVISWIGTWQNLNCFSFGLGLRNKDIQMDKEIGWLGLRFALSELVRVDTNYTILRLEGMGKNVDILSENWFETKGLNIGNIRTRWQEGYYLYNRFYGTFNACNCFLII